MSGGERRDVVIVGGGPAGSSCAWRLRASGLAVTVLDRRAFPRDKTCAGWITPAVIEALALDLDDYGGGGRVLQPIHGFRIGMVGEPGVYNDHGPVPVSYGIRRFEFDAYLLARCGAEVRDGEGLETLERDGDEWVVNGRLRTPLVVGAGGHFCPVARHLGADLGRSEPVVAAQELEVPLDAGERRACPVRPEVPELYFCRDLKGYGWIFRKGDWINVGLGRQGSRRLGEHVQRFCAALAAAGRLPPGLPERFKGHAYLLYAHAPRPLVADGALLVGDAAGLAYGQSGEGIRPAVESGLLAARTILAADGRYERARLEPYAQAVHARFGRRRGLRPPERVSPLKLALARYLLGTHWFTRRVVAERWFLHSHQPALAG